MKKGFKSPVPRNVTVVYQFYLADQHRQYVKTFVKTGSTYGSALRVYKQNKDNPDFISWRVFDSEGYEFLHFERYFATNYYIGSYIPYDYRRYLREEGFKHYEI